MHNGGPLTEAAAQAAYVARLDEIDQAIIGESARWGDNRFPTAPYTRQDFLDVNRNNQTGDLKAVVPDFFPVRTGVVLADFAGAGWLQSLAAPVFNNYGGEVAPGFDVSISKPIGSPGLAEIYYTLDGSDPRLTGGTENPAATHSAGPITIDIDAAKRIKARIKNGSEWSALIDATYTLPDVFPVRITELHYHPADLAGVSDSDDMEFIELLNTGGQSVSLAGVQITQFSTTPYTFGNISLGAGQRIIVARTPAVFKSVYGNSINLAPAGYATANLSNGGERVALLGPNGETLQDFIYDDVSPWPTSPDGFGPSLEIINPLGDPASAANWRASAALGGSPGTSGLVPPLAGDYDSNGTVEQADLISWRSSFGLTVVTGASADGNRDGTVGAGDYVIWRKNLGLSHGAGAGLISVENIPAAPIINQPSPKEVPIARISNFASADTVALAIPIRMPAIELRPHGATTIPVHGNTSESFSRKVDSRIERHSQVTNAESICGMTHDQTSVDFARSAVTLDWPSDVDAKLWADDAWLDSLRPLRSANRKSR